MQIKITYKAKKYTTSSKAVKLIIEALARNGWMGCPVCIYYTCGRILNKERCPFDIMEPNHGCDAVSKTLFGFTVKYLYRYYPQKCKYWIRRLKVALKTGVIDLDNRPTDKMSNIKKCLKEATNK